MSLISRMIKFCLCFWYSELLKSLSLAVVSAGRDDTSPGGAAGPCAIVTTPRIRSSPLHVLNRSVLLLRLGSWDRSCSEDRERRES